MSRKSVWPSYVGNQLYLSFPSYPTTLFGVCVCVWFIYSPLCQLNALVAAAEGSTKRLRLLPAVAFGRPHRHRGPPRDTARYTTGLLRSSSKGRGSHAPQQRHQPPTTQTFLWPPVPQVAYIYKENSPTVSSPSLVITGPVLLRQVFPSHKVKRQAAAVGRSRCLLPAFASPRC